jgi:hypothetical protein
MTSGQQYKGMRKYINPSFFKDFGFLNPSIGKQEYRKIQETTERFET